MLENLSSKLGQIVNNVIGKYRLSESNIKDILKKFRKSLLEADVSWNVVKHIINNIKVKLLRIEIDKKISPGNIFLKIVNDEFIDILGGKSINSNFKFTTKPGLNVILLVGLQGVGKTTSVIKIANYVKKKKKSLIVSCDFNRPAAIDQLEILANKSKIDFFSNYDKGDSVKSILKNALSLAKTKNYDFLIIDSAGRLHIDNHMMSELKSIYSILNPSVVFLVVDGMVGQDALTSASVFCENLKISGFILTKMDGDSRGGVLLSLSHTTKKPIRFLGVGEGLNDLELFYPERVASRILGMGDISGLLEDVNNKLKDSNAEISSEKILNGTWNLNDFKIQLKNLSKIGSVKNIVDKLPGTSSIPESIKNKVNDKYFIEMLAIINSMTLKERQYPTIINGSRKRRIAHGSGTKIQSVNNLLKYYEKMKKISQKQFKKKNIFDFFKHKFSF